MATHKGEEPTEGVCIIVLSEILDEIKAVDTGPKSIRNFGITFLVVLAIIGGILVYKGRPIGYLGIGLGVLFFGLGMWAPATLRAVYRVWMGLAVVLGFFMSRIILSLLFYLVVTPVGLMMRLLRKDILDQKWDKEAASYWIKKKKRPFDKKQYEKLY